MVSFKRVSRYETCWRRTPSAMRRPNSASTTPMTRPLTVPRRMPPRKSMRNGDMDTLSDGTPALNHPDQDRDDRDHDQEVDQAAHRVGRHQTEDPEHEQHHRDRPEHVGPQAFGPRAWRRSVQAVSKLVLTESQLSSPARLSSSKRWSASSCLDWAAVTIREPSFSAAVTAFLAVFASAASCACTSANSFSA